MQTARNRSTSASSSCTVPPQGPGGFYPYWAELHASGSCALEFGNVSGRGPFLTDFGKDAQYGTNQFATLGYPEFIGPVLPNTCAFRRQEERRPRAGARVAGQPAVAAPASPFYSERTVRSRSRIASASRS